MTKHIGLKTMNQGTALATGTLALSPLVIEGLEEFKGSFDRLCLQAGTAAIEAMLVADAEQLCGKRYQRHADRQAYRWGLIGSEIGWHGGKAAVRRPRVRRRGGAELELPSWTVIQKADLLSRWAFNQMLIGVATRKYARSVRLPDGDLAGQAKRATTKSSVSRRFVALSTAKLKEWLAADLSGLDLLVIQIDGLHVGDHVLVAAIGIDGAGDKHVLALALGATENAAVVKALLADLIERGLQPDIARLFIVDGAKALSRAVRDTFGGFALIQRCQVHKGRNIIERLDPSLHAGVKKVLRQAWDSPTAEQAERVLKNLARRLDRDAPGVSASILEGLDEMLTVIRLGLPPELRRSLGCTNAIESLMAVLRQVCRNVKRWRDARMALRWTATAMLEAEKSFRRLKAHKQLPILRAALLRHQQALLADQPFARKNWQHRIQPMAPAAPISTSTGTIRFLLAGLLTHDTLWQALLPAGLYFGFHLIEGETLTPMLLARRFTLNPVLVIISLVFWFWMWGIPGGILSMPMLAITKIICDRLQPLAAFGHFLEG